MDYRSRTGLEPEVPEILDPEEKDEFIPQLEQEYYNQLGTDTSYELEEQEEGLYQTQEEYDQLGTEFHADGAGQTI
ncbi:MAG: hypothetical protein ACI9LV_000529 [Candidatus Nanohaloarchaea archaeon]|jgi:hypothetical protein